MTNLGKNLWMSRAIQRLRVLLLLCTCALPANAYHVGMPSRIVKAAPNRIVRTYICRRPLRRSIGLRMCEEGGDSDKFNTPMFGDDEGGTEQAGMFCFYCRICRTFWIRVHLSPTIQPSNHHLLRICRRCCSSDVLST